MKDKYFSEDENYKQLLNIYTHICVWETIKSCGSENYQKSMRKILKKCKKFNKLYSDLYLPDDILEDELRKPFEKMKKELKNFYNTTDEISQFNISKRIYRNILDFLKVWSKHTLFLKEYNI